MKRSIVLSIFFFTILTSFPQSKSQFICGTSFIDSRDRKAYTSVLIGTQCWMGQNLDIGTQIISKANPSNNSVIEKYCYNDLPANCDRYGGLYSWDEVMQYTKKESAEGICPDGWHIPSEADWTTLNNYLGADVSGGKMKEAGTKNWLAPNKGGTNTSGFTALPAGFRMYTNSTYKQSGVETNFWSSTLNDATSVVIFNLDGNDNTLVKGFDDKRYGYSARCIKN
jgi:uncharacterized protein (TIGR02145 family)